MTWRTRRWSNAWALLTYCQIRGSPVGALGPHDPGGTKVSAGAMAGIIVVATAVLLAAAVATGEPRREVCAYVEEHKMLCKRGYTVLTPAEAASYTTT